MALEIITELITETSKEFKAHLALENNDRILFSGKFGKGKTTFLTEFFSNQEQYNDAYEYDPIFLDPVNYTVSSNEDIFKYIKYDILLHLLLRRNVEVESIEFSFKEASQYYLSKHPFEAIKGLLKYVPKIGMMVDEATPGLEKLYDNIRNLKTDAENTTEDSHISEFVKQLQNEAFSIYENDIITELIRKLLLQNDGNKNVLVIDNLDRIDPEHIFRILNIFSAQMHYSLGDLNIDKFMFDKTIVVCDIQNIRNIYANRYGADVDFSGYIDKFYSVEIFYFQNYEQLRKTSHSILRKLLFVDDFGRRSNLNDLKNDFGIFYLITTLIWQNYISLRQLLNFCNTEKTLPDMDLSSKKGKHSREIFKTPLLEMMVLSKLLGGYNELDKILNSLQNNNTPISSHEQHFYLMVYYQLWQAFAEEQMEDYTWQFDNKSCKVKITGDFFSFQSMEIKSFEQPVGYVPYRPTYSAYYKLYREILHQFYLLKYIE